MSFNPTHPGAYILKELRDGMRILIGDGPIQKRLCDAVTGRLVTSQESDYDDLHPDMVVLYKEIRDSCTAKGSVPETTEQMSDIEAMEITEKYFQLYEHAMRYK